jgi:hypothetical protein
MPERRGAEPAAVIARVDPARSAAPESGPGAGYPPGSRRMGLPAVPP